MEILAIPECWLRRSQHLFHFFNWLTFLNLFVVCSETLPLLSRPGSPNKHKPTSYLQTSAVPHSRDVVSVSPLLAFSTSQSAASNGNGNAQSWNPHPGAPPRLHTLGWLEYHLPDGSVYYVHPTNRVTTEINLRSERMLTGVERFLADQSKDHSDAMEGTLATGGEIWLRDVGTAKSGMILEKWWVDHRLRTVVMAEDEEHEYGRKGSGKGKAKKGGVVHVEEDREFLSLATLFCGIDWCRCCFLFFFFQNLIPNSGIGRSWKHTLHIILFLRKPKRRQWTC